MNTITHDESAAWNAGAITAEKPVATLAASRRSLRQAMEADGDVLCVSADPRPRSDALGVEQLRLQFVWALAGVSGGILWGMLFGRSGFGDDRVPLYVSVPLASLGLFLGLVLGLGVSAVYKFKPAARWFLTLASFLTLGGEIGALEGWIAGGVLPEATIDFEVGSLLGMSGGAVLGILFGLAMGTAHLLVQNKEDASPL